MVSARTIGVMLTDPQRGHVALFALRDLLALPDGADACGIASCVDRAVLLSRKPTLPPRPQLARLVGPLKGRCALIQIRATDELRPPRSQTLDLGPWRSKQFAASVVGGPQDPDQAALRRDELCESLPDFLRRNVMGHHEAEAFFFAVLAQLHDSGQLDRASGPEPQAIASAIRALHHDDDGPRHVAFATGLEVIHVSLGFENSLIRVEGIAESTADELDPTLSDSAIGRERLRRFRGVFALGRTDGPVEDRRGLPAGAEIISQANDSAVLISRDLELQPL